MENAAGLHDSGKELTNHSIPKQLWKSFRSGAFQTVLPSWDITMNSVCNNITARACSDQQGVKQWPSEYSVQASPILLHLEHTSVTCSSTLVQAQPLLRILWQHTSTQYLHTRSSTCYNFNKMTLCLHTPMRTDCNCIIKRPCITGMLSAVLCTVPAVYLFHTNMYPI